MAKILSTTRPITFDRVMRWIITILFIVGLYLLVDDLSNVLLPFCLACLISYILEPIVEFCMDKLKIKWRIVAIFLTLIVVGAVLVGLAYIFIPSIIKEVHQMGTLIRDYATTDNSHMTLIPKEVHDWLVKFFDDNTMQQLLDNQHIESLLNKGTSIVFGSLQFLLHTLEWFLTFIYVIFILLDYNQIMRGAIKLVPPRYRKIVGKVCNDIKVNMNHYFRGQAVLALCAAVFYTIGFSIVGIPMAILLGILVGVLYMIPYFQYVTLIPVAFVCLIQSMGGDVSFWHQFGSCIIVYVVSQCTCDYVLTPKIMGKELGLNPAIILLSLSIWGSLLGLLGMIIALPLTTLLLAYYREYIIEPEKNSEDK